MLAVRTYSLLCRLITYAADKNVLTTFCVATKNKIRVVGNLSHLHNQAKDISVIVEHNTLGHICVKLALSVRHYTLRKVPFDFTEELVVDDHVFWRQLH
jgi:hypothetical protein